MHKLNKDILVKKLQMHTNHKLGAPSRYILLEFELDHVLFPDEVEGGMEPCDATTTHPLLHESREVLP